VTERSVRKKIYGKNGQEERLETPSSKMEIVKKKLNVSFFFSAVIILIALFGAYNVFYGQ
jgi:hypothetical protein